jgi:hypothetical protein
MASGSEQPLEPQLAQYIVQFEDAKATVRTLLEGLTNEQFNQRPTEDSWSAGEIVDHLCILSKLMLPRLDERAKHGRSNGLLKTGPFRYDFMSRFFITLVGKPAPDKKKRKLSAPKMYHPGRALEMQPKVDEFVRVQDDLIACARSANGLNLARIKVSSPVTFLIRISLGGWFEALAGHQLRHFDQIRNVRATLGVS